MRRRAHWRALAVLAVLHEEGPCYADELAAAVRIRPGALYPELSFLLAAELIVAEEETEHPDRPARTVYRTVKGAGMVPELLEQLEQLGERNVRLCTALEQRATVVAQATARAEAFERRVAELEAELAQQSGLEAAAP